MSELIFFKPIPKVTIWGGEKLKNYFNYGFLPSSTGQCWVFSAQSNESNEIINGEFKGKTLLDLWENHGYLFNKNSKIKFPFIVSLVGAEDDLSIQVHPNDFYAKKYNYLSGKNEAWYFIDTEEKAEIVYGHKGENKDEFIECVKNKKWNKLLFHKKVKKDDFVYIPAGELHALKGGNLVYEIQQASDVTYRFYDYDRVNKLGEKRELHIDKALECVNIPSKRNTDPNIKEKKFKSGKETIYISNQYFSVKKIEAYGELELKFDENYLLVTVIGGEGKVNGYRIKTGDNFLIPYGVENLKINGNMKLMMTYEGLCC
ncbi:mannose-6-phosphate isomerase, class I [Maledivibacter halophilus]|uniref:mannose-6-phosphate isomerase n=1 Tax=Maledivibacter halophilus TaxID=36842 RepID=A0A1T5KD40_9FIRM|nr:mannose-6-phosphate isomerase, class I [Maledivibacter halophilus]SKC61439.1 mannose-6-phosphate isomerase, type 1 [Maledivibacter halophilus]